MKKIIPLFILSFLFAFSKPTYAVCPVCTIAVGAGVGVSRWIGIDDTVTGLWIGGLIISSGLWLANWIRKKNWKIPYPEVLSTLLMLIFVIPPLYWSKMIGISNNVLLGIDKVILGTIVGSILFLSSIRIDKILRKTNNGKVYIYYQKVILPVLFLSITSFIFYLITL
jgi:hypothetical protein